MTFWQYLRSLLRRPARIKVYRLDDNEWWAGESLEACIAEGRKQCGTECYDEPAEQHQVSPEWMQRLKFVDEDGTERSFAEELERLVTSGAKFPCSFAAENY